MMFHVILLYFHHFLVDSQNSPKRAESKNRFIREWLTTTSQNLQAKKGGGGDILAYYKF